MKISILLILTCTSFISFGQEISKKKESRKVREDLLKKPRSGYWDYGTENNRDEKSFNFLDLKQIERIYTGSQKRSTLFILNNKLVVKNLEATKIDSSFIRSVEVINSHEITQLRDQVSEFTILDVKLHWKYGDRSPKHLASEDIPKFYFAPAEKKEIKMTLPSEASKRKEVREFHFLNLKDIESKYTGSVSQSTLFFLNGELLTSNLNSYQIDSSYIHKVEILTSSGIEYLKDNLPVFNIIRISLATPEKTGLQGYIRGSEMVLKE